MTFSGLLSKALKQNAAANSTAGATKPGAVAYATTTTSTGTTPTQGNAMVSPKSDSSPAPGPDSVLSIMASSPSLPPQQQQPPQPTSIDPTVLSVDPRSSSTSQMQLLSSPPAQQQQQPTITKLDIKQPTPFSPPSTTPSSPSTTVTTTKKKKQQQQQVPQNLSTAQSASYRKRLNVNQVCDWCRYRKIRCDREAPCNSCQHSKRECIRTPPEVLLSKLNKDAEDSSTTTESTPTTSKATKRSSPADEQDDQTSSLKTKKVARSNSIASSSSSHINVEQNNSSNNSTTSTTLSTAMTGPRSLSPPSAMGLSLCGEQPQQPMTILSSGFQGTPGSLQDQEHLERMRRIEMLLSNVIPGAAEFIAYGHRHNHQRSNSFSAAPSEQRGQQQHIKSPISPVQTAAGSPLGLTPIQDDSYIERMKRIELLLGSVQGNNNALVTKLSLAVPPSTAGAETTGSSRSGSDDDARKGSTPIATRKYKAAGTKKVARNNDGTIIKRPHVAAGFAGQKPPPKLPQAIAEAALRKLAGKKKKRASASSATNASTAATTAAVVAVTPVVAAVPAATTASAAPVVAVTVEGAPDSPVSTTATTTSPVQSPSVPQPKEALTAVMLSSPKSFDIPAAIENHHHHHRQNQENSPLSFTQQQLQQQNKRQRQQKDRGQILARQQQQQQQQQQHSRPGRLNTQLRTSTSYHPHRQHHQRHTPAPPSSYLGGGGGHPTNMRSISIPTIPLLNTMTSYESLVVPACNSADSSPASSPRTSSATTEFPTFGGINGSSVSVCGLGSTSPLTPMDFLGYGTTSSHHSSFDPMMHNGGVGGARVDFPMALNMIHPGPAGTTDQLGSPSDGTNSQVLLPFATHGAAAAATAAAPMYNPHFLQQHAMHIPQDTMPPSPTSLEMQDFTNRALQMTESLESWMNSQLIPSLDIFSNNSNIAPAPHTNSHFLAGAGFGQPEPQYQQMQSFYIPQMQDDEEDDDSVDEVSHE